jgi:hypothetical protein
MSGLAIALIIVAAIVVVAILIACLGEEAVQAILDGLFSLFD